MSHSAPNLESESRESESRAEPLPGPAPVQVQVLLFAVAAERAGTRQVPLALPLGCRIDAVGRRLLELYPGLQAVLPMCRWAVDCQFVADDFQLTGDVTLAVIPPVSGG